MAVAEYRPRPDTGVRRVERDPASSVQLGRTPAPPSLDRAQQIREILDRPNNDVVDFALSVHPTLAAQQACGEEDPAGPVETWIFLPPYAPKLNPVERVWFYLRERFLSLRLSADFDAIIEGCCNAWNRLVAEPGRIASPTDYPYLQLVRNS